MKKWLALGVLAIAGLSAFAATCVVSNTRLTTIGNHKVFAGQLKNDSGANFLQHNVIAALIDGNGNVVETKTTGGCLRSLQNGATNYFSVTSTGDGNSVQLGLARLALDGALKAGDTADGDISISGLRIRRQGAELRVTGTLRNNDDDRLYDPAVCAVVRDEAGNVVIVAKDVSISDLDEDEEEAFELTFTVLDDGDDVDNVSVYADGVEGSAAGTPVDPVSDENNDVTVCGAPSATATHTPTATGTPQPTSTATATATATPCF